jgi:hypothetical protein
MSGKRLDGGVWHELSIWRCWRHFWTYLGYLDECQRGVRSYGDSPPKLWKRNGGTPYGPRP